MFDVAFSELALILIVGLVVLGPERLPGVIRTASHWIGKIRRSFNDVKAEIEREIQLDEIKRDLHNQSIMDSLKDARRDLDKLRNLPYDVSDIVRDSDRKVREATADPDAAPNTRTQSQLPPPTESNTEPNPDSNTEPAPSLPDPDNTTRPDAADR